MNPRSIQILDRLFSGNVINNPFHLLFLICLVDKAKIGAAYRGPPAACRAGAYDKHGLTPDLYSRKAAQRKKILNNIPVILPFYRLANQPDPQL